jgi:hypothetical protein
MRVLTLKRRKRGLKSAGTDGEPRGVGVRVERIPVEDGESVSCWQPVRGTRKRGDEHYRTAHDSTNRTYEGLTEGSKGRSHL